MKSTGRAAAAAVGAVLAALLLLPCLVAAAASSAPPPAVGCGPAGTGLTVAGVTLSAEQVGNAAVLASVAAQRPLSSLAAVIAVATAMQESGLVNLDSGDRDSLGLFQQRPSQGWGTAAEILNPVHAATRFYDALVAVPNWSTIPLTAAAQAVQRSAYPDAYARWQPMAVALVGQLWPLAAAPPGTPSTVVCPGGGGDGSAGGGGSTSVPAGFTLAGSAAGVIAVRFALAQLGKPYVWAAAGPDAYDCSGLTMAAWAAAGITLGHFTGSQVTAGTPAPTDLTAPASGDLVFIPGSDGTAAAPRHVGMLAGYVPAAGGARWYLIQAPHTGTVVQLTPTGSWAGQIVAVRHIA